MYSDVQEKIKLYKNKIIKDFIEKGEYPSIDQVNEELNMINLYDPFFEGLNVLKGDYINVEKLNKAQLQIYEDLCLLYELIYKLSIVEYIKLEANVNLIIDELERESNNYKEELKTRTSGSSLGKTIFFQDRDFKVNNNMSHIEVDLGDVEVRPNSYLTLTIDAVNKLNGDIIGQLGDYNILPYDMERSKVYIEGERNIVNHSFVFEENENMQAPFFIPIDIDSTKDYVIFSGENMALIKDDSSFNFKNINNLYFKDKVSISFYAYNMRNLSIDSTRELIDSNFNIVDGYVHINKRVQKIDLTINPDTMININFDSGKIFATKERGVIINEKVYYNSNIHNGSFYIDEISKNEPISMPFKLKIYKNDVLPIDLKKVILTEEYDISGDNYD